MEDAGWKHYLRLMLNILIPVTGWILLCVMGPKVLKFFMPFVIGWIIAMIANPLVRFLERRVKLVRKHSSIVIVVAALALVVGLIYLILSRSLVLLHGFMKDLPALYEGIEGDVARSMEQIEHLRSAAIWEAMWERQWKNSLPLLWRRPDQWPGAFPPYWCIWWSLFCLPISLLWTGIKYWP